MGGRNVSRIAWLAVLSLAAALVAGCATTGADSPEVVKLQARAAYERAVAHIKEGQASLALTALQEAIRLDPTAALYENTLGWLFLDRGRPDLALEHFSRATSLDPAYADAHLNTGVALAESGRWEEAVVAYRKALNSPTLGSPEAAHQNLGLALFNLKRYKEAEAELRFAISLDPAKEAPYYNLGLVYTAEERKEEARLAFRRARDLAPNSPFGRAAADRLRSLGDGG
jgi:Tfp pilus assembly protein PilF